MPPTQPPTPGPALGTRPGRPAQGSPDLQSVPEGSGRDGGPGQRGEQQLTDGAETRAAGLPPKGTSASLCVPVA